MADEGNIKRIPMNELLQEESAHELATSPDMEPYLELPVSHFESVPPRIALASGDKVLASSLDHPCRSGCKLYL